MKCRDHHEILQDISATVLPWEFSYSPNLNILILIDAPEKKTVYLKFKLSQARARPLKNRLCVSKHRQKCFP